MKVQIDSNVKVAKNFVYGEFLSPDTTFLKLDYELVDKLQKLRDLLHLPIYISSGYRTEAHNNKIGGSITSQHLIGKAVDIKKFDGINDEKFVELAEMVGFVGIGLYDTWYHIDVRYHKARWDYRGIK